MNDTRTTVYYQSPLEPRRSDFLPLFCFFCFNRFALAFAFAPRQPANTRQQLVNSDNTRTHPDLRLAPQTTHLVALDLLQRGRRRRWHHMRCGCHQLLRKPGPGGSACFYRNDYGGRCTTRLGDSPAALSARPAGCSLGTFAPRTRDKRSRGVHNRVGEVVVAG